MLQSGMEIGVVPMRLPAAVLRVSVPTAVTLPGLAIAKPVLNPPSSSAYKSTELLLEAAGTEASENRTDPLKS